MKIVYTGEMDPRLLAKEVLAPTIAKLSASDPQVIFLDADLMGCSGVSKWAAAHPERGINCGIAEANMVGVAAGLAAVGFKPYVHSFGTFSSRRCYDQAFLSAAYAGNPITIIGSDPGVTAAFNGGTHMPFEDMALYRAMPGASVFDISDGAQLISLLTQAKDMPGVKYIRMPRKNVAKLYGDGEDFPVGRGIVLRDGKDIAILASGIMVHEAMQAASALAESGIDAAVIDMFSVKPLDEALVQEYALKTGALLTAENHNRVGGLYSAVCECAAGKAPVSCVAVEDRFGAVGPQPYLQEYFGLTAAHITEAAKQAAAAK